MPINVLEVIQINVTLPSSVVLTEDCGHFLFCLVVFGFDLHRKHKVSEAKPTCLSCIELRDYLIHCLFVWIEPVLLEEHFDIVGEQHAHLRRIVGVEHFLEINDIVIRQFVGDVSSWIEDVIAVYALSNKSFAVGLHVLVQ